MAFSKLRTSLLFWLSLAGFQSAFAVADYKIISIYLLDVAGPNAPEAPTELKPFRCSQPLIDLAQGLKVLADPLQLFYVRHRVPFFLPASDPLKKGNHDLIQAASALHAQALAEAGPNAVLARSSSLDFNAGKYESLVGGPFRRDRPAVAVVDVSSIIHRNVLIDDGYPQASSDFVMKMRGKIPRLRLYLFVPKLGRIETLLEHEFFHEIKGSYFSYEFISQEDFARLGFGFVPAENEEAYGALVDGAHRVVQVIPHSNPIFMLEATLANSIRQVFIRGLDAFIREEEGRLNLRAY